MESFSPRLTLPSGDVTLLAAIVGPSQQWQGSFRGVRRADPASSEGWSLVTTRRRDTPARAKARFPVWSGRSARSRRMPRESPDARNDLPEQALCQEALGQLQDEVPGMSDEAPARLEEPLLEAGQGPTLDAEGQHEPAQEIAEIVGDDCEQQADLIGPEPVAGEAVQWVAALPSLIHCSAVPRWL